MQEDGNNARLVTVLEVKKVDSVRVWRGLV